MTNQKELEDKVNDLEKRLEALTSAILQFADTHPYGDEASELMNDLRICLSENCVREGSKH